ncbi:hypothetical protein JQ604_38225 [Bradyrhizobium jicamae]|uniref:hypothetical protein n=1 Tax=Bradyrhizobium jicamae TaxID=280332 RepID=UPI001BA49712|nr:hypothetical protein [Bradyrhizobium jicamae]MBR0758051.1 hypothetical protein [Bradyrhizobium jicamae]
MSEDAYLVDVDAIRRAFPPGTEPPQLLMDFAAWLDGRPWGSVGCFDLDGRSSDHAPIFDGSPLRAAFALFLRLPDGSLVGYWQGVPGGGAPPIVLVESEGQYETLAPTLESFLAKLALKQFVGDLSPYDDDDDATEELAAWLRGRLGETDLEKLTEQPINSPDFRAWAYSWADEREAFWSKHPILAELSGLLHAYRPDGTNPWDGTHFRVAIAGGQCEIRDLHAGPQRADEARAVEAVLRRLRDAMWQAQPELGLWFWMSFRLGADGRIMPNFDYDTRPTFAGAPADLSEVEADLMRAPRPDRWVPKWLADEM